MHRGYIEAHLSLAESYRSAVDWLGQAPTLIAPSTSAVEASPWLESANVSIGITSNRHSRFRARASGAVIAWCLSLSELLDMEAAGSVDQVVLVRAVPSHAPWITAHKAERVGGNTIDPITEASASVRAMVEGLTSLAVRNQGLIDSRERAMVVQALTFLHARGHDLASAPLVVEAIRNNWPGSSPLELADLAQKIRQGKRLRSGSRLRSEVLEDWASR